MKTKMILLILLLFCTCIGVHAAPRPAVLAPSKLVTIPEIVSHAKAAVLVIYNLGQDGNPQSFGSGFFITADGLAVTNRHVIEGASQIVAISVVSGARYQLASIYFTCPSDDLVVLKFYAARVPFLRIWRAPMAVEGQHILVIGNPEGQAGTVSDGLISAFREKHSLMQISAPISPGSSGSPVLDDTGHVIAVAVSIAAEQQAQNLNLAIPVEQLTHAWDAAGHVPQAKAVVAPAQDDYSAFTPVDPSQIDYSSVADPAPQPATPSTTDAEAEALRSELKYLYGMRNSPDFSLMQNEIQQSIDSLESQLQRIQPRSH